MLLVRLGNVGYIGDLRHACDSLMPNMVYCHFLSQTWG